MSTPKTGAPVVGFNHNLMHGGKIFHVQTEDSGLPHAHYITHLFIGGNIVASMKSSYAEQVDSPDLAQVVRKLMEGQHKAMVKRLVAGEFRETAEKFQAAHYAPGVLASGQTGPAAVNVGPSAPAPAAAMGHAAAAPASPAAKPSPPAVKPAPAAPAAAKPAPAAAPRPAPAPPAAAPRPPAQPQPLRPHGPAPGVAPKPPPGIPAQPAWQPAPPTASGVQMSPPGASQPPPVRVPGQALPSTTRVGPVSARPPVPPPKIAPAAVPTPAAGHSPVLSAPTTPAPPVKPGLQPQLHAAKPVNIFADDTPVEKPADDLPTLFAEELISEKSLDEVILAFLSADLDPPK